MNIAQTGKVNFWEGNSLCILCCYNDAYNSQHLHLMYALWSIIDISISIFLSTILYLIKQYLNNTSHVQSKRNAPQDKDLTQKCFRYTVSVQIHLHLLHFLQASFWEVNVIEQDIPQKVKQALHPRLHSSFFFSTVSKF